MADRIKVSTEQLLQIAQKLRTLQDCIAETEDILNGVNSIQGGWNLIKTDDCINGKQCNTTGEIADALRQTLIQFKSAMGDVAQQTDQAARLFEESEQRIAQLLENIDEKENPLSRGILLGQTLGYKRIEKEHTAYDDIRDTNPNYKTDSIFRNWYHINCQRCIVAYELRRRGYDVEALPAYDFKIFNLIDTTSLVLSMCSPEVREYYYRQEEVYHSWEYYFEGAQWERINKSNNKDTENEIINRMIEYGDGARAQVYVQWKSGGAHVFIAENHNGNIVFMDPQTGDTDASEYLTKRKINNENTFLCRIDNLELSDIGRECIKEKSGE